MQHRDMARIKVLRMLEEKWNLIVDLWFSLHTDTAASALRESTVDLQRHRPDKDLFLSSDGYKSFFFSFSFLSFSFLSY